MGSNRIIVRNKVYRGGELNCNLATLKAEGNFSTVDDFKKYHGLAKIMKELFNEEIGYTAKFEDTTIYKNYLEAFTTKQDNEFFQVMYKVGEELALKITEHIYLYHITRTNFAGGEIVPWECVDSKLYVADTWWESDDNVLFDINNLSYIEFLTKYKGY